MGHTVVRPTKAAAHLAPRGTRRRRAGPRGPARPQRPGRVGDRLVAQHGDAQHDVERTVGERQLDSRRQRRSRARRWRSRLSSSASGMKSLGDEFAPFGEPGAGCARAGADVEEATTRARRRRRGSRGAGAASTAYHQCECSTSAIRRYSSTSTCASDLLRCPRHGDARHAGYGQPRDRVGHRRVDSGDVPVPFGHPAVARSPGCSSFRMLIVNSATRRRRRPVGKLLAMDGGWFRSSRSTGTTARRRGRHRRSTRSSRSSPAPAACSCGSVCPRRSRWPGWRGPAR